MKKYYFQYSNEFGKLISIPMWATDYDFLLEEAQYYKTRRVLPWINIYDGNGQLICTY